MLKREEIIGRRITSIVCRFWTENWLDFADCMLELDTGVLFRLPAFSDSDLDSETCPHRASRSSGPEPSQIYSAVITALLRPADDDKFYPGSVRLGLSSGYWLADEVTTPHGTGGAGIVILEQVDTTGMVDFWTKCELTRLS